MTERILLHLQALVAFDSQNPPRNLQGEGALFAYLRENLEGFDTTISDHGDGHVSFHARRGNPRLLFNVHLDTVPVGTGWSGDPLVLHVADGRARGRGACDIKGAAAVLLDLAADTTSDLGLLFTTDEEGAGGCCVRLFCESGAARDYDLVVVAEPTRCAAVTAHRGYLSVTGRFAGVAGHSSEARGLADNALHKFVRWAGATLEDVATNHPHSRFNLGRVDGGIKSNVIADQVHVAFSARLPPGANSNEFLATVTQSPSAQQADWTVPFLGPPLPAPGADTAAIPAVLSSLSVPMGAAVDFWTEASLFSAAGCQTFVLGPGDIAQAHAADEWVSLDQLALARQHYQRLINHYA